MSKRVILDPIVSEQKEASPLERTETPRTAFASVFVDDVVDDVLHGGQLSKASIKKGLGDLGRVANKLCHAYLSLNLPNMELNDIGVMKEYLYLEDINLQNNLLSDLSPLNVHNNMLRLNVSENKLAGMLDFNAPRALQHFNCSNNAITALNNLDTNKYINNMNCSGNQIASLEGVSVLKHLHHLDIADNNITDLTPLDNQMLQTLVLSGNHVDGLTGLCPHAQLRWLDVANNTIASLTAIERHPLLTALRLANNNVATLNEVQKLVGLEQLRELDLRGNPVQQIPNYRQRVLFMLPSLIMLDGEAADAEEMVSAANFHGVNKSTNLAIWSQYLPRADNTVPKDVGPNGALAPPYFKANSSELREKLTGLQMTEEKYWKTIGERGFVSKWEKFVSALKHNPKDTIDLSNAAVGDIGLWVLAQAVYDNPRIKHVNLEGAYNPSRHTAKISALYGFRYLTEAFLESSLTTLNLSNCHIDREAASLVAHLLGNAKQLTVLNLAHNKLGDPSYKMLPNGERVVVHSCPALAAICDALQDSQLTELDISDNNISCGGAMVLAKCLSDLEGKPLPLKTLTLTSNPVNNGTTRAGTSDIGGVMVMEALRTNKNMEKLVWQAGTNQLDSKTIISLARTLSKFNDSLTSVDISGQDCGDAAATELAQALLRDHRYRSVPSVLKSLSMRGCGVGSAGVAAIAKTLTHCGTLVDLDLSFNTPDDPSVAGLLDAASKCSSLRSLDVTGITLNNLGIKSLAALVSSNTALTSLRTGGLKGQHTGEFTNEFDAGFLPIHADSRLASLHTNSVGGSGLAPYMQTIALKKVVDVGLGANTWDAASWQALCAMLRDHKFVQSLDLSGSTIPNTGSELRTLLKATQTNGTTTALKLNGMDVGSIKGLGEGLTENKVLRVLELCDCNLGANSQGDAEAFVMALHSPISLKVLHLRNNNLDLPFLRSLVEGLRGNTSLQELYLSGNELPFTPALASLYGDLVCASPSLQKLEMFDLDMGDAPLVLPSPPKIPDDRKVKPRSNRTPRLDIDFKEDTCPATIGESHEYSDASDACINCGLTQLISLDINVISNPPSRASSRPPTRGSPPISARGSSRSTRAQLRSHKDVFVTELANAFTKVSSSLLTLDVGIALRSGVVESQRQALVMALVDNASSSLQQLVVRGGVVGQAGGDDLEWNALSAVLSTNRFGSMAGTIKIVC